jgi:pimeloyl-ACP methyl ester carboxylesterase
MAILTHLRMYPSTVNRLRAIALVSTAAGELPQHGGIARFLPLSVAAPLVATHSPTVLEWGWDVIRQASTPFLGARGCTRPSAAALAGYLTSLRVLDETATLDAIRHIPTLVMCGSRDHVTPLHHSQRMCDRLDQARLVTLARAGHQLPITHPARVAAELAGLADAALGRQLHMAPTPSPISVA